MRGENAHRDMVSHELMNCDLRLVPTSTVVDVSKAVKLPLSLLPELGVAFASMPAAFRTVTSTLDAPTLLRLTDKFGNPLDPGVLNSCNDGSGLLASFRDSGNQLNQARLHVVEGESLATTATIPYDPTTLFLAVALAQVNKKLDSMKQSIDEMFEYLRQREKAEIKGSLQVLTDIVRNYRVNSGNAVYMANAHMKVLDVIQKSRQDMELYCGMARRELSREKAVEGRAAVGKRLERALDYLKDYQMSLYLFAYATFLEPILSENFESEKLQSVVEAIKEEVMAYRRVLGACYDQVDADSLKALDSRLLDGVSRAGAVLGKTISHTPLGTHSNIDKSIGDMSEAIARFNDSVSDSLTKKLREVCVPDLSPFEECMQRIDALYNEPTSLAADSDTIYVLCG